MTDYISGEHQPVASRLDALRGEIDSLDRQIVALIVGRTSLALQIADAKQELDVPTMVADRHDQVIRNYTENVLDDGPLTPEDAIALGEIIMRISRSAQDKRRLAAEPGRIASTETEIGLTQP